MINKLLLVDGSNLLFQMFFGMPSRIVNNDGKAIQGTLGFVGALLKIIRMVNPTHILVVFDGQHKSKRNTIDKNYKANRIDYSDVPDDKNPFSQIKDVYKALDFIGIKHFETTDCETDDIIATYTLTNNNCEIVISSFDSDFFQLINEKVFVLRYRGKNTIICTPEYIFEKYGVFPKQFADFKALVGDSADNIKGAEKVGNKTAAMLLNEYNTLDNMIVNANCISKFSVKNSIINNADKIKNNYKIIKLNTSAAVPFNLGELSFTDNEITTMEILHSIGLK